MAILHTAVCCCRYCFLNILRVADAWIEEEWNFFSEKKIWPIYIYFQLQDVSDSTDSGCQSLCLGSKFIHMYEDEGASQVALVVKSPPANAGDARDAGSIAGLGRSPWGGQENPLQYSCLGSSVDPGTGWATVCGVPKNQTTAEGP